MRGEMIKARPLRAVAAALALGLSLIAGMAAAPAEAAPRGGFIVFEPETGRVLREVRSTVKLHPASLTKMMTLYLTFEALENGKLRLDQKLRVSRHAARMPAMEVGLRRGDRITVRDAIRSAAVHSANDSAVVLAEAIGGSERAFARRMTEKARELEMRDTVFKNATGFTARGHLTTARDMAILARRLWMDFPQYYNVFSKTSVRVRGRRLGATNGLLGEPGVDGIKTGYTRAAGYNLAASAEREGKRISVVLLGGRTKDRRNRAVADLLDDGFVRLEQLGPMIWPTPRPRPEAVWARLKPAPGPAPIPTPRPEPEAASAEVAAAAEPEAPIETAAIETADAPKATASVAASAKRRLREDAPKWAVQLGAFFYRHQARSLMAKVVAEKSPGLIHGFRSIVTGVTESRSGKARTVHRVRFTGLSEDQAREACRALLAKHTACALVPPQGWGG